MSMNRVVIVGRLVADVELRYTQNGKAVGNFTVASNRPFKNAQGEQEADFIRCQAWGKQAENLANYMKKGNQIGIDGRIQTGRYEDKDGKTVFTTDVVADNVSFLEPKNDNQNTNNNTGYENKQQQTSQNQAQSNQNQSQGEPLDITDDMLPF